MHRCRSKLAWQRMTTILNDAGYATWPIHRTRVQLAAMTFILINQVAAATGRSAYQVRDALMVALRCSLKGNRFAPWIVRSIWARMPVDIVGAAEDRSSDRVSVCPCCGRPLPEDLPEPDDLDPETPQNSPQSGGCEVE